MVKYEYFVVFPDGPYFLTVSSPQIQVWNPKGERGNVCNQQQHQDCSEYERYDGAANFFQRDTCYAATDEKTDSKGWSGKTNDEIQDHHGPKVYWVQAELLCQWQENGGQDDQ